MSCNWTAHSRRKTFRISILVASSILFSTVRCRLGCRSRFFGIHSCFGRSLSETGIVMMTVHERHSYHVQAHKWKYLEDRLFDFAADGAHRTGFGYGTLLG